MLAVAHGGSGGQADALAGQPCGPPPTSGAAGGASDSNALISPNGDSAPSFSSAFSGAEVSFVKSFSFQPHGRVWCSSARAMLSPHPPTAQLAHSFTTA